MRSEVYVTVGLDKQGNVVEVRAAGQIIEPKEGARGLLQPGGNAPGCEEIVKILVHELLTCGKKGSHPGTPPPPPGSDPCCYRDPQTGRLWCWC
jgi:hypothetical protein